MLLQFPRFVLAVTLNAAPSIKSRVSIPFATACCRSSVATKAYTLFKLGSGSSERTFEQAVPYRSKSNPIRNWWIFLLLGACSSVSHHRRSSHVLACSYMVLAIVELCLGSIKTEIVRWPKLL